MRQTARTAFIAEYRKETNTDMSLEVNGISKQYGNFTALHPLSFTLSEPGVYALLGTNGAGKTTAIRIILGMLSRNSGEVLWNGKALSPVTEKSRIPGGRTWALSEIQDKRTADLFCKAERYAQCGY